MNRNSRRDLLLAGIATAAAAALPCKVLAQNGIPGGVSSGVPVSGPFDKTSFELIQKLRRLSVGAAAFNPLDAALASGVTMTMSGTHNASLTKALAVPANNSMFAYHGGTATQFPSQNWVLFPVASVAPSTAGNLAGYLPSTPSLQSWTWEAEFMTDALIVEIKTLAAGSNNFNVIVDGQFVTSAGGNALAGGGTQYVQLDFGATRKDRHIRFRSRSTSGFGGVSIGATENVWQPNQQDVLKVAFTGDSYGEGQGLATSVNPDGAFVHVVSHLLGWRDPRQVAVGSTGYLQNATTRSKIRDQIPNWAFTPDVIVCAAGTNDTSFAANAVGAEAALALQAMRAVAPMAPIFVVGPWAKNSGPSATYTAMESAISSAVSGLNDPKTFFIPTSTTGLEYLFGTGYSGATNGSGNSDRYIASDQTHPTDAGHAHIGRRVAADIRTAINSL